MQDFKIAGRDSRHPISRSNSDRWSRLPVAVLVLALLVSFLHLTPFWRAQSQTPPGWEFTGNLVNSPDQMQYHMLALRSQVTGPIVDNPLTSEPTKPHITMVLYYTVGKIASWLDVAVPFAMHYVGAIFAFIFVVLLFVITRHFLASRYQTWWTLPIILLGGGLGAHLILLSRYAGGNALVQRLVTGGLQEAIVFENYRNHYIFTTLFDSHFLVFTTAALLAIVAFYRALSKFSALNVILAAIVFGAATILHIYEGVTLVFIAAGITFMLWRKRLNTGQALIVLFACAVAAGTAIVWQMYQYKASGVPVPTWRAQSIYFSELVLAYPLAWGLMAWGLGDYWRKAGFNECFLLGWTLGSLVLTLSGPFYPYSDRGVMTLQIPIYLIAASIFFAKRKRVGVVGAVIVVLVLGVTPVFKSVTKWNSVRFKDHPSGSTPPYIWMSPEHQEIAKLLHRRATENDVLAVDKTIEPWKSDDLWLAPGFPGKLYAGHYALTPEYPRKQKEIRLLLETNDPLEAAEMLNKTGIRFLYVDNGRNPERLKRIPGLTPLREATIGTLFEYLPANYQKQK